MNLKQEKKREHRKIIILSAYNLFVNKSIEEVTLNDVAKEAGVGIATVFRHFTNKVELVVEVAAYVWEKQLAIFVDERPLDLVKDIEAVKRLEYSLDLFLKLYQENKMILKFNNNFNSFVKHENVSDEVLEKYIQVVNPMTERFHFMYEKAKVDKSFRTDLPEDVMMRVMLHLIMAATEHYTDGFIWGDNKEANYFEELIMIKNMIMDFAVGKSLK